MRKRYFRPPLRRPSALKYSPRHCLTLRNSIPSLSAKLLSQLPFFTFAESPPTQPVAMATGEDEHVNVEVQVQKITKGLATASLDELQSNDYRHVLDIVDRLRMCGLGSILQLPQLVVCGNQSSGKSSVLEAITEVPFPRKENLCTRFATEIVMRRDPQESIRTKIIPDKSRSEAEQAELTDFNRTISDFSELPDLIDRATDLMGLGSFDDEESDGPTRAFSRDVLSIELAGPERAQLTLVDLPGLILAANKIQSEEDVKLIHELVNDYLTEKRTIMLAVVSAKDDYANQGVIPKCKAVDQEGHRTLGIITKPDWLRPGTNNEKSWLNLAQNKDIYFHLGWHMVKNRPEDDMDASFQARNASEAGFFSTGAYRTLQPDIKGISQLRIRLSQLLYKHLKKELPHLQAELNAKHAQTVQELGELGEKRSTVSEQKRFLMGISTAYQTIVASAVDGHYEHPFFVAIDTTKGFEDANNMRRLRAAVQHYNLQFASQMRQFGHKFRIPATDDAAGTNSPQDLPEPPLHDEYAKASSKQQEMSREDAVDWVKNLLVKTRGRELPGNFNPLLMSQLFWEQSENWEELALAHIDRIDALCSTFVRAAIQAVVTPDIADRMQALKLDEALQTRRQAAVQELDYLIKDKQRAPITYDPSYTATVQGSRGKKTKSKFQALVDQAKVNVWPDGADRSKTYVNPDVLQNGFQELLEPDMDKTSAEDALDSQLAYYKVHPLHSISSLPFPQPTPIVIPSFQKDKVKYFIAAVTEQVIERHLLHDLAEQTLSPMLINDMADGEVAHVAAEAEEVTHKREFLEDHRAILEEGRAEFRRALGRYG